MSWFPHLAAWHFALAGATCAIGPIVIHLLNRRRYKVIHWGAMDLLREAMQSQQRILRLRNLILLLLRVAAVLLFGLALARPYFSTGNAPLAADTPRHLVLLIDNSLSMAYQTLDGTLLERAQRKGAEFIESLPTGSRVSIVPLCNVSQDRQVTAAELDDALSALRAVEIVDGTSRPEPLVVAARRHIAAAKPLADQLVLLSDMQQINWPRDWDSSRLDGLPALLVCDLSVAQTANTWVAELHLNDEILCPNTRTTVFATVRHQSEKDRSVQVTLTLDGRVIATRTVELAAGDSEHHLSFECLLDDMPRSPNSRLSLRESSATNVPFEDRKKNPQTNPPVDPSATASQPVPAGDVRFAHLSVSIAADRLTLDDERHVLVPVVEALPIVFVDQCGDDQEDLALGLVGETLPIRQLLAPKGINGDHSGSFVKVHHITASQLNRQLLASARLVVIAGLRDPTGHIPLLRDYVEQGGPLLIAAGGEFDPMAWSQAAWLDGLGILPGPLGPEFLELDSDEPLKTVEPMSIAIGDLLRSSMLQLPGVDDEELRLLYAEPVFMKAVDVQLDDRSREAIIQTEADWIRQIINSTTTSGQLAIGKAKSDAQRHEWLDWNSPANIQTDWPTDPDVRARAIRNSAQRALPVVHARLVDSKGPPLIVETRIGRGRVIFFASGFLPEWTSLPQTNAVVMLDRIARDLIHSTLSKKEISINGDASESDLAHLPLDQQSEMEDSSQFVWLRHGETSWAAEISQGGRSWWRTLVVAVLALLLLELAILAQPRWQNILANAGTGTLSQ